MSYLMIVLFLSEIDWERLFIYILMHVCDCARITYPKAAHYHGNENRKLRSICHDQHQQKSAEDRAWTLQIDVSAKKIIFIYSSKKITDFIMLNVICSNLTDELFTHK